MRISDWSSDVCSSDLQLRIAFEGQRVLALGAIERDGRDAIGIGPAEMGRREGCGVQLHISPPATDSACPVTDRLSGRHSQRTAFRSEEHTSELQSLMRISYAVFCLTKKQKQQTT